MAKLYDYIPAPERVSSDYYISCHYYPGWDKDGDVSHKGMEDMKLYPDRRPMLGYYNENNPEVMDWEIKWACEHGINCFLFCWYRYKSNEGKPVTRKDLRLAHIIHEVYKKAKFREYMDYAIMWECQKTWGAVSDADDLVNHLLPFWVENYFTDPGYMKINGKPIVYVYDPKTLVAAFGSAEKCAEGFALAKEAIKKYGFDGILFACEQYRPDMEEIAWLRSAGFDFTFQYGWYPEKTDVTEEMYKEYTETICLPSDFVIDFQQARIKERIKSFPGFCMFTHSVSRDATEKWLATFGRTKLSNGELQWCLSHSEYKTLLAKCKAIIDNLPDGDIGKKYVVIDNWNEWGEGHFISPCAKNGFKYLQAVREVYTACDNLPDYRTPEVLGFGPYEE